MKYTYGALPHTKSLSVNNFVVYAYQKIRVGIFNSSEVKPVRLDDNTIQTN